MEVPFPEHRIYTLLACFQAAFVMIGTFAIRIATSDFSGGMVRSTPLVGYIVRNWGFIFLLVPVASLGWAMMDMRQDPEGRRDWKRVLIGVAVTLALGVFFWLAFEKSAFRPHGVTEIGNM